MKIFLKNLVLSSRKLRNELRIAFGLIIVSVLVFLGYLFPGVSSIFEAKLFLPISVAIALFIVIIGFLIIVQIVEPIIKITSEAKKIANGDLDREIQMAREDEIGELGIALNQMTKRIKDNVEELARFSKQTEAINLEINQRILTLSSLVEISNLIAQSAELEVILKLSIDRILEFGEMSLGCLILKDRQTGEFQVHIIGGSKREELLEDGIKDIPVKLGKGLIGKTILKQNAFIIDRETESTPEVEEFKKIFKVSGGILAPITSKGNVFGLLIVGNENPEYVCTTQEKEIYYLMAKQIAVAFTNELLKKEIEKLEVTDNLTGLFNNTFTRKRLNEDIKRAATLQQPCSFVLFSIDKFNEYNDAFGHIAAENVLIKIGSIFKEKIAKGDKAARFGDHEFALILPGKNKKESIAVAEEIRAHIKKIFEHEEDPRRNLTCSGAITENPIDGMTADELILKSGVILGEVMYRGGNEISY